MIKSVVIPVAGLGTRNLPATKSVPKEMLPILDRPAIHYIIEEAYKAGLERALLVSGRHKKAVEDYFDSFPELEAILENKQKYELLRKVREPMNLLRIFITRQHEARGLGHAVLQAKHFINEEAFGVILPDDVAIADVPYIGQLIEVYKRYSASVIAVEEVAPDKTANYGIIKARKIDENIYEVLDMVEKPKPSEAPSNLGIIGRYVLKREIFDHLENLTPGAGGELQLTDAMRSLLKEQKIYAVVCQGQRYDIGNPAGFLITNIAFALESKEYRETVIHFLEEHLNAL